MLLKEENNMASALRSIKRNQERTELTNMYGKKPKHSCPKCGKLTLFQHKDKKSKKIICVRCKKIIN